MKTDLMMMAAIVAIGMTIVSCGSDNENMVEGTGDYYTFVPHGTITKAGYKTKYCILPIRTKRLSKQNGHVSITVDDEWK